MNKKVLIPILLAGLLPLSSCGTNNIESPAVYSNAKHQINFGKEDYKKVVKASNQFGFNLLTQIDPTKNLFISPASAFLALSMVYNGADGETKDEMTDVLQTGGIDTTQLNQANASLMALLTKNTKQINVSIGNSIWLNEHYHFEDDFAQNTKDYYHAETQEIDVMDKDSSKLINEWVKEATNKKIDKIASDRLDPNMVAMLINAIYFKGTWKYEFDKKYTKNRPFHLQDGTISDVPLMLLEEKLDYLETEGFQAIKLPYGDNDMSMTVFLPKGPLDEFSQTLTNDNWEKWNKNFQQNEGTLLLPAFKLDYEKELSSELIALGMNTAFEEKANFSKMIKEDIPIWISKVKQKAYIKVSEEGTEAAAATAVEMKTESAVLGGFHMEVNKPFFFTITDNESGTILFMGSIQDPS
jgi:serine protease inhibitor